MSLNPRNTSNDFLNTVNCQFSNFTDPYFKKSFFFFFFNLNSWFVWIRITELYSLDKKKCICYLNFFTFQALFALEKSYSEEKYLFLCVYFLEKSVADS